MERSARVDFLPAGTRTGKGWIAKHDITRYGLGRLCIEQQDSMPDIATWMDVVLQRGIHVILCDMKTRETSTGNAVGQLWLYYKMP